MNVSAKVVSVGLLQTAKYSPTISFVRHQWNRPKRLLPAPKKGHNINARKRAGITEELGKIVSKPPMPFMSYDEEFAKVTTFENQLQSLNLRGFQRSWRPFQPPQNAEKVFFVALEKCYGKEWTSVVRDFSQVTLNGEKKAHLLAVLAEDFGGHRVPNSLLHTMTTLDKVFSFYSTPVSEQSPYDKLEAGVQRGDFPQNLHVQIEPLRFDPTSATSDLGKISAFPKHSTLLVSPEARKKWKPFKAKGSPYKNSENDD